MKYLQIQVGAATAREHCGIFSIHEAIHHAHEAHGGPYDESQSRGGDTQ